MKLAIFGVAITFIGNVLAGLGWAFQKKAFNKVQNTQKSVLSQWIWWIGWILIIIPQPMYVIGVSMANQSTIGAVGPFALISNMILARFYLKEEIRKWEYISIALLIPGVIITLNYASMENQRYSSDEFSQLFFSTISMLYLFLNLIAICCLLILSNVILDIHPIAGKTTPHHIEHTDNNFVSEKELESIQNKEIDQDDAEIIHRSGHSNPESPTKIIEDVEVDTFSFQSSIYSAIFSAIEKFFISPRWRAIPLIAFPYASWFFTSLSMTFSRCVAGIIITDGESPTGIGVMPIIYAIMVGVCWIGSYIFLNKSLKYFNTIYVVPLFKVGDLYHNLLSGGIFLREFGEYEGFTLFLCFYQVLLFEQLQLQCYYLEMIEMNSILKSKLCKYLKEVMIAWERTIYIYNSIFTYIYCDFFNFNVWNIFSQIIHK